MRSQKWLVRSASLYRVTVFKYVAVYLMLTEEGMAGYVPICAFNPHISDYVTARHPLVITSCSGLWYLLRFCYNESLLSFRVQRREERVVQFKFTVKFYTVKYWLISLTPFKVFAVEQPDKQIDPVKYLSGRFICWRRSIHFVSRCVKSSSRERLASDTVRGLG